MRIYIYFYFSIFWLHAIPTTGQEDDGHIFQALYDSAKKHQSVEKGQLALDFALQKGEDAWIAKSYFLIAYWQKKGSKYYEALKNHFNALKYYKEEGGTDGQIKSLVSIGNIYSMAGFHEKSLSFYEEAFALIHPNLEIKTWANLEYNYAKALRKFGDHEAAKEIYMNALRKFREIEDKLYIGWIYLELGLSHVTTKNYKEAKKYYSLAANVFPEGSTQWETNLLKKLCSFGYIAIMEDQPDSALHLLQYAEGLSTDNHRNQEVLSLIYENMGVIYRGRNQVDSAILMYDKAVQYGGFPFLASEYIQGRKLLYTECQKQDSNAVLSSDTLFKSGDELAKLQYDLNAAHIKYQVEAVDFEREVELRDKARKAERLINTLIYTGAGLSLISLFLYFYIKENRRKKRIKDFFQEVK